MTDQGRARERLERERARLDALLAAAQERLGTGQEDASGELTTFDQHPADVATDTLEREQDESVREHAESELEEVDAALARLDAGTYGRCQVCGQQIPEERLEVLPQTRYCIRHQHERERAQDIDRGASA